ncbi:MAG: sigma-70 family RNA polymerase sigma factor [Ruminococcaceae bacterium]|nr:sigma-70 family RNA polymerase sigma factor [Oscillospiraceae bacterium]
MEDKEIVELFLRRNETAISAASEKYKSYCMKIAGNILVSRQDAEECINDTLMKAWELIPPYRPEMLSTFLGKITRNFAINIRRKQLTEKRGGGQTAAVFDELSEIVSESSDFEQEQERKELIAEINGFLRGLPSQKRNIFICRYWYCDSVNDIAAQFGITENNVSVILNRVRKKLKQHLEKAGYSL